MDGRGLDARRLELLLEIGLSMVAHALEKHAETRRRLLWNVVEALDRETRGAEDSGDVLDGREGLGHATSIGKVAEQRDAVVMTGKGAPDEHRGTVAQHPPELASARRQVRDVVHDGGEPRAPAATIPQRKRLCPPGDVGHQWIARERACLAAHAGRWLDADHSQLEPVREGARELPGPGADVQDATH